MISGNLNFLETSRPLQTYNRTTLPFTNNLKFVYSWAIFGSHSSPHEDFSPVEHGDFYIHISVYEYVYSYFYCTNVNDFLRDAGVYKAVYTASRRKRLNIYFRLLFWETLWQLAGHETHAGILKLSARLWSENPSKRNRMEKICRV